MYRFLCSVLVTNALMLPMAGWRAWSSADLAMVLVGEFFFLGLAAVLGTALAPSSGRWLGVRTLFAVIGLLVTAMVSALSYLPLFALGPIGFGQKHISFEVEIQWVQGSAWIWLAMLLASAWEVRSQPRVATMLGMARLCGQWLTYLLLSSFALLCGGWLAQWFGESSIAIAGLAVRTCILAGLVWILRPSVASSKGVGVF